MADTKATFADVGATLDAELAHYERLAQALAQAPLQTAKQLRRAATQLGALAECEQRLETALRALVTAVGAARERQQATAAAAGTQADAIRRRGEELTALLARWESLGRDAAAVHEAARSLLEQSQENGGAGKIAAVAAQLDELTTEANHVGDEARTAAFEDLAHEADALRKSLRAVADRLRSSGPRDD